MHILLHPIHYAISQHIAFIFASYLVYSKKNTYICTMKNLQYITTTLLKIITLALLLFHFHPSEHPLSAQTPLPTGSTVGSSGTDFWVTWFDNAYNRSTNYYKSASWSLVIVGDQSGTITISNDREGFLRTINHVGGTKTYTEIYTSTSAIPSGQAHTKGYHVTSDVPVSLFASNYYNDSWDACNVLPTSALGTEYIVQDYSGTNQPFAAEMALVATEDNTHVSMVPPCPVAGLGNTVGDTFAITLNAGQSLMLRSTTAATFCGMPVNSDKPIALFQGHTCAIAGSSGGRDLALEQARPLSLWGTEFIVTPTLDRTETDYVIITAGDDNCTYTIAGTSISGTLSRGQTYVYTALNGSARHITTSKPALVSLSPHSYDNGRTLGDPALVTINPTSQWVDSAVIPIHNCNTNPYDEQYITDNHHYLNIVTRTAHTAGMTLDGTPVTGFTSLAGGYSYARLHITPGVHTLVNSQGSFTAHAYGLGKWVCYAFETGISILQDTTPPSPPCSEHAAVWNDFWVAYLFNGGEQRPQNVGITVVGDSTCQVTVRNPITNWQQTATLNAGSKIDFTLPDTVMPEHFSSTESKGFHVTATAGVQVVATLNQLASSGLASVIPTHALGDRYIVLDYPADPARTNITGASVTILATADNTTVNYTSPCTLYTRPGDPPAPAAGTPITHVFSMAGQTLTLRTNAANTSLSGMEITSDKPIAVFQGNQITAVPHGTPSSDLLYEQSVPVHLWGQTHGLVATARRSVGDRVRVAADSACTITLSDGTTYNLADHGVQEFDLSANSARILTSTKPVSVGLCSKASDYNAEPGDASLLMIPPMERGICHGRFSTMSTQRIGTWYVAIVTDQPASMTFDGNNIASQFQPIGTTAYSYARFQINAGTHRLDNDGGTFTAWTYGIGNVESYIYSIGQTYSPLQAHASFRDTVEYRDTTCLGTLYSGYGFTFDASQCSPGTFHLWDSAVVGDTLRSMVLHLEVLPTVETLVEVSLTAGDTLAFADTLLTQMGEYRFTYTAANGCDSVVVLRLTYRLIRDTVEYRDTTCLGTLYSGYGFTFDASQCSPGTFHLWDSAVVGDTLRSMVLHLEVLPTVETLVEVSLTAGDTLAFADTLLTQMGEYRFTYTAANGCDSVVVLRLTYESTSITASADDICPGDSVELTAQGTLVFHWSATPPDPTLASQQGRNPIVVHPTTTTTYILADATGNTIASHTVSVEPPPAICIENSRKYIDFDHPVVTMRDCSEGRHRTTWDFDDGAHFTGERMRRIVPYPLPDSIAVTMTSCNRWGCCADTTVVMPTCTLSVWFPNIFTPDEATNNRFGCVTTYEVVEWDLRIFNRWGLHVWSTQDITQPWDGTHDGTPVKQEAYIYQWSLRDAENRFLHGVGTVTLLR